MNEKLLREQLPYRPCVGVVVFNSEGKVWAGKRIQNAETNSRFCWQLPQGGIDADEEPALAARRELYEETGISSVTMLGEAREWWNYDLPDNLLGIGLKGKFRGQTQKWFAFRFEGSDCEINILEPADGSKPEFEAWEWKPLDEMPGLIVPFKREIYHKVVREFSSLAAC